ncbi:MAG: D-2-hydroxyacid dehydrogenase, partial [Opitutaceae bacterium]
MTNAEFPPAETALLEAGVAPHRLVRARTTSAAVRAAGRPDPLLAEADVAFGQPDAAQCLACPRLRWVEVTTAGYTRYDTAEFREGFRARGAAFTNASSV